MSQSSLPPVGPTQIKRFRTNPVELVIFSVISLIFFNSVYNLFYDQQGFHLAALQPMSANPATEGRAPASTTPAFVNLDVRCEDAAEHDTHASKVRLTGVLCDTVAESERSPAAAADPSRLVKTQVVNTANKFAATVFTDVNAGKFSTDYIPLNLGKNPIHLEFTYRGGRVVTHDVTILKNP